jgi:(p)ppGpp synthase/HD superfamily hydrolase
MDPLRHVKFFATVKHAGQLYKGLPYTHHLAAVEGVLRRFQVTDPDMLTAAWLHDAVEDTETSLKEVREMFGDTVGNLVGAVTDEPGPNRKVRHALTYPKIRTVAGAVQLKLADRIANVEAGGNLVRMYREEHEDFKRALYTAGQYEKMWEYLDLALQEKTLVKTPSGVDVIYCRSCGGACDSRGQCFCPPQ